MVALSRLTAFDDDDEAWHARRLAAKVRRLKVAVAIHRKRVAAAMAALSSGQGPQGKKRGSGTQSLALPSAAPGHDARGLRG